MNRNEFSSLLVECREANGIGKNELCRLAGFSFLQLQRLENARNDYNMRSVFQYLSIVKSSIILQKDDDLYCLNQYSQYPQWLFKTRSQVFSLRKLAKAVNCAYSAIANAEHEKTVIRIDLFLKIVDALGYSLCLKPMLHID